MLSSMITRESLLFGSFLFTHILLTRILAKQHLVNKHMNQFNIKDAKDANNIKEGVNNANNIAMFLYSWRIRRDSVWFLEYCCKIDSQINHSNSIFGSIFCCIEHFLVILKCIQRVSTRTNKVNKKQWIQRWHWLLLRVMCVLYSFALAISRLCSQ